MDYGKKEKTGQYGGSEFEHVKFTSKRRPAV
jgi:hypothetical protein